VTKVERAKIGRDNRARSENPVTPEGKERSARTAIKDGARAEKRKHFIPPHKAVVAFEKRKNYQTLVDNLIAIYQPLNDASYSGIAVACSQIDRLNRCITTHSNLAHVADNNKPAGTLTPGLHELRILAALAPSERTQQEKAENVASEELNEMEPEKNEEKLPHSLSKNTPAAGWFSAPRKTSITTRKCLAYAEKPRND